MGLISGKCPDCGADLKISDSAKGELKCPYCGSTYLVENAINVVNNEFINNNNFSGANVVINQNAKDAFIKQYLENARRALKKEDWEEVEKYYNMVEQYEPKNIEAIFYSSYGKAMMAMIGDNIFSRKHACHVLCNNISIIDDNYDINKGDENVKYIEEMDAYLFKMYSSDFVVTVKTTQWGSTDNSKETVTLFANISAAFVESVEHILKVDDRLEYRKILYRQYTYLSKNETVQYNKRYEYEKAENEIGKIIQKQDPSFVIETPKQGCYIATCVYGSYDCPQVWTLRRYRDERLATTWYGRAFIHTYYAISPKLVKLFGNKEWFKKIWKHKLDRKVKRLQDEGVESCPYKDKVW